MLPKKLKAIAFLAYHFILHFVKKIFRRNQRHKNEFIASYKDDRIFPIPPSRRPQMQHYSHCYACRLCDTVCPQIIKNPVLPAPSYLTAAFSRSLTDFHFFTVDYTCVDCAQCEETCPQNVPIKDIISFMTEVRDQIFSKTASSS